MQNDRRAYGEQSVNYHKLINSNERVFLNMDNEFIKLLRLRHELELRKRTLVGRIANLFLNAGA